MVHLYHSEHAIIEAKHKSEVKSSDHWTRLGRKPNEQKGNSPQNADILDNSQAAVDRVWREERSTHRVGEPAEERVVDGVPEHEEQLSGVEVHRWQLHDVHEKVQIVGHKQVVHGAARKHDCAKGYPPRLGTCPVQSDHLAFIN